MNSDAIYIPTDNTAASNGLLIDSACRNATKKTPVICGEEGSAKLCGVATLSISYYDLGVKTGQMAADVLLGKEDITTLKAIRYLLSKIFSVQNEYSQDKKRKIITTVLLISLLLNLLFVLVLFSLVRLIFHHRRFDLP